MAKAKKKAKKKELSLEEKLEQVLIPVDEQPYEIPENWCWTRLEHYIDYATDYVANGSFASLKENVKTYKEKNYALMIKTQDFSNGFTQDLTYTDEKGYSFLTKSELHGGELLLSNIGASIGKVFRVPYLDEKMTLAPNTIMLKTRANSETEYEFLRYYFMSPIGNFQLKSITTGSATPKFNKTELKKIPMVLPPLAEQQRIVEQIESLFAKLDEAKENAESVLDSFDKRKAALYNMAFTGRLTEQWRKINDIDKDKWISTTIGDVSEVITKGASPRWQGIEYTDDKTQTLFVTSENVREGYLDLSKEKYLDNKINEIQKRSVLHGGDVLVNIVGASIGRAAIYNLEKLANTNQAVCIVRLKDKEINDYVCFYLNSPTAQQYYYDNKVETARANISLANISSMPIMLPPEDERKEIMSKLKYLLEKEDASKEMVNNLIDNLELMKKSILAKAFRGELGTNHSDEESAIELLKSILATE